ncbi:hypothetical protein E2C01_023885 [Portunus trituberculatus]|uniref:Uncharacterized protein n=1 Tax=Portunus trituberculatus TaxID=210409 RepID=A0A5B7EAG7_PORTR|nr:hypothetical protein [Portunus trituberculatus]
MRLEGTWEEELRGGDTVRGLEQMQGIGTGLHTRRRNSYRSQRNNDNVDRKARCGDSARVNFN